MKKNTLNQGEIDIKKYKKIKRINNGGFGIVYKIEERRTGNFFAAKVIDCADDEEKCNEMINREISIMLNINHPTIIKFVGYSKIDFQEENNVTIIMELCTNGSLKEVLKKIQEHDGPRDYTNTTRQIILVGISRGMKYLHEHNIIHRDLKADNILLDEYFHPHITDFGLSKIIELGHSRSQSKFGGTLAYEAPEILREEKYDIKVDVYSFGILMYEVLTDSVPYPELEGGEIAEYKFISKIVKKNYRPKFRVPIKNSLQKLIERCWSDDPNERPTFSEIFNKLSNLSLNKKIKDEDEDEDFLLEDVDVEELKLYIEDVTEVTDFTEKLQNRVNEMEREIQELKTENNQQRKIIKKYEKYKIENKQLIEELDQTKQELNQTKAKYEQTKQELDKFKKEFNQTQKKEDQTKQKLSECKREMKQSKDVYNGTKSEKKQYTQSIIVGGYDQFNGLGEKPNNKGFLGSPIISPPVKLSFDPSSLLSYSAYSDHSVLVMSDGSLKGVGKNGDGRISATLQKTFAEDFTDFSIKDDSGRQLAALSAVCYVYGTLYMFSKNSGNERLLVLCDKDIKWGTPVFLDIGNHHPVSLFGGFSHSAAIGSEGEVIFINRNSVKIWPKSRIAPVSLPGREKASSVACCEDSVVVLSSNGRVFTSRIKSSRALKFSIVSELSNQEIVCVSGTFSHFLAVSKEGRVFGRGSNERNKLCLGKETKSVSSFTEISSLFGYKIRAAYAGRNHSLFETREGKILSCGWNPCGQLLINCELDERSYFLAETTITSGASFCIAGIDMSAVFIGSRPPRNMSNSRIREYE